MPLFLLFVTLEEAKNRAFLQTPAPYERFYGRIRGILCPPNIIDPYRLDLIICGAPISIYDVSGPIISFCLEFNGASYWRINYFRKRWFDPCVDIFYWKFRTS